MILCKGIYKEDPDIAIQERIQLIDLSYDFKDFLLFFRVFLDIIYI